MPVWCVHLGRDSGSAGKAIYASVRLTVLKTCKPPWNASRVPYRRDSHFIRSRSLHLIVLMIEYFRARLRPDAENNLKESNHADVDCI
jgi:hypothetical protein